MFIVYRHNIIIKRFRRASQQHNMHTIIIIVHNIICERYITRILYAMQCDDPIQKCFESIHNIIPDRSVRPDRRFIFC